jgi:hypothetical protein
MRQPEQWGSWRHLTGIPQVGLAETSKYERCSVRTCGAIGKDGPARPGTLVIMKHTVEVLSPAETAVHGNTHMIMQDKNNQQIADSILKWIDEPVSKRKGSAK